MPDKALERSPYRLREQFLSAPERALLQVLRDLMGSRYLVSPKVALNDLFYIVRPNENVHFFNKLFRKNVDFLLCDLKTLQPAFGVEIVRLNGKGEPREGDKFMEELFIEAGLPLALVPSAERYDAGDIIKLFQAAVKKSGGTIFLRMNGVSDTVPNCPLCGKMMVLRINRDSAYSGKKYYGCMDSPRCGGIVPID